MTRVAHGTTSSPSARAAATSLRSAHAKVTGCWSASRTSSAEARWIASAQRVAREQLVDAAMDIVVDVDASHAEPLCAEGGACLLDAVGIGGHFALFASEGGGHLVVEDLGSDGARGLVPQRLEGRRAFFDEVALQERGGVEVDDHRELPAVFEDDLGSGPATDAHRWRFEGRELARLRVGQAQ